MGTREHIIAYLAEASELFDANGMASTRLAAAVGYPGSSVAFAQLLSGMERSGLIEREVRGKRTYRISLGLAQARTVTEAEGRGGPAGPGTQGGTAGLGGVAGAGRAGGAAGAGGVNGVNEVNGAGSGMAGFDYDELARRLLVQVVRRLADNETADSSTLQETVAGLEYELASAWTKHGKLAEENVRLREQLKAAQESLALARERVRRLPVSTDLDSSEVVLLQRLLSPGPGDPAGAGGSGGDAEDLQEARSMLG